MYRLSHGTAHSATPSLPQRFSTEIKSESLVQSAENFSEVVLAVEFLANIGNFGQKSFSLKIPDNARLRFFKALEKSCCCKPYNLTTKSMETRRNPNLTIVGVTKSRMNE